MSASIDVRNVAKSYRVNRGNPFAALDGVSFHVAAGEFVSLVGASGCGKTTLLDLIGGLTLPDAGEILIGGRKIEGPGLDRGIVFQQYALFPWRTALGNVAFGLEAKGVPKAERLARARRILELVGLSEFADRYPHQLSGGMKQRVAIARSLAYEPDVLLMDEPFAALDAQTRETLQHELLRIWKRTGTTVVFITHSIDEAIYLGQRVLVMAASPGRVTHVLPVNVSKNDAGEDVRATPEFVRLRHEVWQLIRSRRGSGQLQVAHAA
ncbi:ABC transporter ATP-binding protein [Paraburkholderia sp. DD10]|jgi:NitT/TauT family transport system ATP-binding protein|uniref:ABC transporter ATP-binding protein n=1 Tax=Paraburkholderia TaxID=1822464 RepID=UPI0009F1BD39|nr:ABC transporter ATP-binding protein [Burkholderia sp. A27]